MSFASLLINTCTISRFAAGAVDAYGNPAKAWSNHLTGQHCRWSSPTNREVQIGAQVVVADLQLFLNIIDVTEQDRVVLDGRTYEILSVAERQNGTADHHIECLLRAVK